MANEVGEETSEAFWLSRLLEPTDMSPVWPLTSRLFWNALELQFGVRKAGDLLWHCVHGEILTGQGLHWIDSGLWDCPIDGEHFSPERIWYEGFSEKEVPEVGTMNELVVVPAVTPKCRGASTVSQDLAKLVFYSRASRTLTT